MLSLLQSSSRTALSRSRASVYPYNKFRPIYYCNQQHKTYLSTNSNNEDGNLVISILGPPNVGKSTLFNRLMCKEANKSYRLSSDKNRHRRKGRSMGRLGNKDPSKSRLAGSAIVSRVAGTTRDRRECIGRIGGVMFKLVDTAGVDGEKLMHLHGRVGEKHPEHEKAMIGQTLEAAKGSDLVLLMFDAKMGVTSDLNETARWLRSLSYTGYQADKDDDDDDDDEFKKVVILGNKLEGDKWTHDGSPVMDHLMEAEYVGFGEAMPISAEHGEGLADVAVAIDKLTKQKQKKLGMLNEFGELITNADLEQQEDDGDESDATAAVKPLKLTILGRQNVGKSTLVNALLNEQRVITGSLPGLTRDSISVAWKWQDRPVQLVDTAGLRKASKRNTEGDIEDLAVADAMRALKVADVAVLVIDADAKVLQRQELAIADAVVSEGRSLVIVANKMDLLVDHEFTKEDYARAVSEQVELRFPMLRKTPVVAMSSLTGQSVHELMPVVFDARDRWEQKIPTGLLNRWLIDVVDGQNPPVVGGRHTKIKYAMQTKGRPPTFLLFCNVDDLPVSYLRYLTRNFQDTFGMFGMEVRMALKKSASSNPFSKNILNPKRGSGLGGKDARRKRIIKELTETGKVTKKGRRRRKRSF